MSSLPPRLTVSRLILYRGHIILMSLIFCYVILFFACPASFIIQQFCLVRPTAPPPLHPYHAVVLVYWDDGCVSWCDWKLMPSMERRPLMLEIWSATVPLSKRPIDEVDDETTSSGWLVHGTKHCSMHWVRTRNWIPPARRWRGIGLAPFMDINHWLVFVLKLLSQFHQTDGSN